MREIFRGLIVVSTASYLILWFIPYVDGFIYAAETIGLRSMSGFDALIVLPLVVFNISFAAWLLAAVGMFFFQAWARSLFLWLYVLTTFADPFLGTIVFTGLDLMLFSISTVLDGAVLAIAYLTSIERLFVQPRAIDK